MTWTAGIAIYLVIWWTVLFIALPFGVRSQHEEEGSSVEGTDPGAPVAPMLVRKALVTTVVAAVVWLLVAYIYIYQPISFDSIPFMPKLHDWYGTAQPQTAN